MWMFASFVAFAHAEPLPNGITEWEGTYTCGQGLTRLALTISRDGDELWASFSFGPHEGNPAIPSGNFTMAGERSGDTIALQPDLWRVRPDNYVMVALDGEIEGNTIAGTVDGPGCTTFSLRRTERAPALPIGASTWKGSYTCRQGLTSLALDLRQGPLHDVTGTFSFSPSRSTPRIPSGRFSMSGYLDPATGEILLDAGEWLARPEGWITVDLRGKLTEGVLSGDIVLDDVTRPPSADEVLSSGCSTFVVSPSR